MLELTNRDNKYITLLYRLDFHLHCQLIMKHVED